MSNHPAFEAVIGLEVHCQLATDSKIFCSCRARLPSGQSVADIEPNSNTCPVCAGHPGTLPVLNRRVVEYAIKAGLATHCSINPASVFARKNYFYPDLPKGYQLSQYDQPICLNGWISIETEVGGSRKIPIQRIHMEEDAGKNVHSGDHSLVNLNRAGVPLIEIVTGPDLRSAVEAGAYLRALHAIVTYLGITDGNMQEGNFRCDANVSVMPRGSKTLGTRAEIKNVNSFRFIEKAIDYEIARQIELVQSGGRVVQETRLYDSARNVTASMRSKEEAMDYRYFPEPDLQPVLVESSWIEVIRGSLPELPEQRRARYTAELGLGPADAHAVTSNIAMSDFFEQSVKLGAQPKTAANLITGELARLANEAGVESGGGKLTALHIAQLSQLTKSGAISSTAAKQVLSQAFLSGESAEAIVDRQGLRQVSDTSALGPIIDKVLASSPSQVAEFRAGKEKVLGYFVGQIMKESGGKANPGLIQEMIRKKLTE